MAMWATTLHTRPRTRVSPWAPSGELGIDLGYTKWFSRVTRRVLAMERLVRKKSLIFNLAGQVSHIDSMLDPFTDLEINCRSQLALLDTCRRVAPGPANTTAGRLRSCPVKRIA